MTNVRRAITWIGGGVFVSALLQYALFFAAARQLGLVEYGAFSLAFTVAILAAQLCDLGTSVSLVFAGSRRPAELQRQFGASLVLRLLAALPVGVAAIVGGRLAGYGDDFAGLFLPLFVTTLADGIGNSCSAVCQARERMAMSAVLQVARNLLRGAALVGTLWVDGGAGCLAWNCAAWSLLTVLPSIRFALAGLRFEVRRADLLPTLRLAAPFGAANLATLLHSYVAVTLLGVMGTDSEVGSYHAVMRFVLLLQMVPQVVGLASAPLSFRAGLAGIEPSSRIYRVKLAALAPLGLLATLALVTQAGPLVDLCLGEQFRACEPLLVALAPIVFVKFVSSALRDAVSALARQRALSIGCWLALLLQVAASLWTIPELGTMGAVLATLLAELFLAAFLAVVLLTAGMPLAWNPVLRHSLAIAAAAGLAAVLLPPVAVVPAGLAALAALLWWSPSIEERVLLRATSTEGNA